MAGASDSVIVALDVGSFESARNLSAALATHAGHLKVGKRLFTACGPKIVELICDYGGSVMLDLKFHDIPNTVGGAVREAVRIGADMITVHAVGGSRMIERAKEEIERFSARGRKVHLLAITLLTSLMQKDIEEIGIKGTSEEIVLRLARVAISAGADGVVASPNEIIPLRKSLGSEIKIVSPGIRPAWFESAGDDQKRTSTPFEAIKRGASHIVVGRPVIDAKDPIVAFMKICGEIEKAVSVK